MGNARMHPANQAQTAVCKSLMAVSLFCPPLILFRCGTVLLRSQYFCLGLEPVVQRESVNPAALHVQIVGAETDALFDVARIVRLP
jgi:hypothetical protein